MTKHSILFKTKKAQRDEVGLKWSVTQTLMQKTEKRRVCIKSNSNPNQEGFVYKHINLGCQGPEVHDKMLVWNNLEGDQVNSCTLWLEQTFVSVMKNEYRLIIYY